MQLLCVPLLLGNPVPEGGSANGQEWAIPNLCTPRAGSSLRLSEPSQGNLTSRSRSFLVKCICLRIWERCSITNVFS